MDDTRGPGCLPMIGAAIVFILLVMMVPDGDGKSGGSTTNSRTGTLSGNQVEVLSRNQLNLWSDVQNCYGDGSCTTIISTTTSTLQNTSTDTRNTTTVNGDRNVVIGSDGARLCEDPITHIYTTTACEGGQ